MRREWTPIDDSPIITSLLEADFYKFTMGQWILHRYPDVQVTYGMVNRTLRIRIADEVSEHELRKQLDHVRALRFTRSEIHYLRGTNEYEERMFTEDWLRFLEELQLPPYELRVVDGQFELTFTGRWPEMMLWETLALTIVNELRTRAYLRKLSQFERDALWAEGMRRLREKITVLRDHPGITFADFGNRRAFSRSWQAYIDEVAANELPKQFRGTSNTYLAMQLGLMPIGTKAHEISMVLAALAETDEALRGVPRRVLESWWVEYGSGLSIMLPDTFGTPGFLERDVTTEILQLWKGFRQDSGDPFDIGEQYIRRYDAAGIDSREKLVVFSDSLVIDPMVRLHLQFRNRLLHTFGWGGGFTNDFGLDVPSLVIKPISANGRPTVKLSDNLEKAVGPRDEIERYVRVFDYHATYREECRY